MITNQKSPKNHDDSSSPNSGGSSEEIKSDEYKTPPSGSGTSGQPLTAEEKEVKIESLLAHIAEQEKFIAALSVQLATLSAQLAAAKSDLAASKSELGALQK